jgi:hypothetical protein
MRRLIRPRTVFPTTCQNSTLRSAFGTASYRQLAGSSTFLCAHVASPTPPETHATNTTPSTKMAPSSTQASTTSRPRLYKGGILALASHYLVLMYNVAIYNVAICHPSTYCYAISGTLFPISGGRPAMPFRSPAAISLFSLL